MKRYEPKLILRDFAEKRNDEIGMKSNDFIILKIINKKNYGFVAKVKSKLNDKIYVMKKTDLTKVDGNKKPLKYFRNEYNIIKQLNHENVANYSTSFKQNNEYYIISEYSDNGNLLSLIKTLKRKKEKMKEEKLLEIFLQCLNGLKYIHSLEMIHRNIKPANIIIDSNWQVRLIDFKMAVLTKSEYAEKYANEDVQKNDLIKDSTYVNVDENENDLNDYLAPEIKTKDGSYDNKMDIFSLGITFCYLAFQSKTLPNNHNYSKDLYDLIEKMISNTPDNRPSASELYKEFEKIYINNYFKNRSGLESTIRCLNALPNLSKIFINNDNDNINILHKLNQCLRLLENNNYKDDQEKNEKPLNMNIALYSLRETFYKNNLKNLSNNNKEIKPAYAINFIILELIKELRDYFNKLNINSEQLVANVVKETKDKVKAYEAYVNFYNHYFRSFISDNFFGTLKTKRICKKCNNFDYSYNFYHMIPFNIKYLSEANPKNKKLSIHDAFDCLNKKIIETNDNYTIYCLDCEGCTSHLEYKNFYNTPKYLIL